MESSFLEYNKTALLISLYFRFTFLDAQEKLLCQGQAF